MHRPPESHLARSTLYSLLRCGPLAARWVGHRRPAKAWTWQWNTMNGLWESTFRTRGHHSAMSSFIFFLIFLEAKIAWQIRYFIEPHRQNAKVWHALVCIELWEADFNSTCILLFQRKLTCSLFAASTSDFKFLSVNVCPRHLSLTREPLEWILNNL